MRRTTHAIIAGLLIATAMPVYGVSHAEVAVSELAAAYNSETDAKFRKGLQVRLAWTGDYRGDFTGTVDARTLRAIRDFQARHALPADGVITEPMLQRLVTESDRVQRELGTRLVEDDSTGVRALLPLALVDEGQSTEVGRMWRANDGTVEVETVRLAGHGRTLNALFELLSTPADGRTVTDSELASEWFELRGTKDGRDYFMRFAGRGEELRGFTVFYDGDEGRRYEPFIAVAANLFEPFASDVPGALVAEAPQNSFSAVLEKYSAGVETAQLGQAREKTRYAMAYADPENPHLFELPSERHEEDPSAGINPFAVAPEFAMAGSGFVVSQDGWLMTNAHVVAGCEVVRVGAAQVAQRTIIDEGSDLALVKVAEVTGSPLPIVTDKPRLGEEVLALGYPLRSILADSLNVTRGNISSLLGLMNDPRFLQISAPVQPGNSGGPLIDLAGRVVGVVTAKLNAIAVADATGDIPQAINFAIRPDAAADFLRANGISFKTAEADVELTTVPDATARVMDSVHPVICER